MASKLDITLPEASVSIVKRHAAELSDIIETKFGCVATIEGVDWENKGISYHRQPPIISPSKRSEFMIRSDLKLSVWKADLTNFSVDAVVNAANGQLNHCGGLALALSNAGGPKIQLESNDHVKRNGDLKTGDSVVFDAGLLQCRKIIHAVGPYLPPSPSRSDVQKAKPLLETVIWSILKRVADHQLPTVAIPAISSGLFNYPLPECAHTIVSTIKQYYENLPPQMYCPKEIFLANNDEPTVQEMERACRHIFSPHLEQYRTQVAKNTQNVASTHQPSVQIGNVLLTLMKGKIEEQLTDVIVNTASKELVLSKGEISRAILNKAGFKMQMEIDTAVKKGNIICTKAYQLKCREVYHTICTVKGSSPAESANAQKILESSVLQCLTEAAISKYNSISFPAIGTGNLGFHKKESAWIMTNAVAQFAERSQSKLDVCFVIFPLDHETYQAFEYEIKTLQQKVSKFMLATAPGPIDDSHSNRALTPKISLLGPSDESIREAKKWLSDLLFMRSSPVEICNNFISHLSEEQHQELSLLFEKGLVIEEFLSQGHVCITIASKSEGNAVGAVSAAFHVEGMLCKIHKEFMLEEEHQLKNLADMKVSLEKKRVKEPSQEFTERLGHLKHQGLWVVKVDKVENFALQMMFDMKKKQLRCSSTQTMFQRIPAQFCEMISQIGFQAECAPPEDPVYGEGIYFTRTIKKAMEVWRRKGEEYLYFVEAEVLTGKSARGKRGMILPPPVGNDPNVIHDSLEGPDVSVIFSGYQALPKYIIVCQKSSRV